MASPSFFFSDKGVLYELDENYVNHGLLEEEKVGLNIEEAEEEKYLAEREPGHRPAAGSAVVSDQFLKRVRRTRPEPDRQFLMTKKEALKVAGPGRVLAHWVWAVFCNVFGPTTNTRETRGRLRGPVYMFPIFNFLFFFSYFFDNSMGLKLNLPILI